jgi:hypothetical protein
VVVLLAVGLVDAVGDTLDSALTIDEIAIVGEFRVGQLDQFVHEKGVFADTLDGLDQLRGDSVNGLHQVGHFLVER